MTDPPEECTELMDALYDAIDKDPTAKKTIDDITKSAKVTGAGRRRQARQLERQVNGLP